MTPLLTLSMERRHPLPRLATALLSLAALVVHLPGAAEAQTLSSAGAASAAPAVDPLRGARSALPKDWVGSRGVSRASFANRAVTVGNRLDEIVQAIDLYG
jgi:hypothetical protein